MMTRLEHASSNVRTELGVCKEICTHEETCNESLQEHIIRLKLDANSKRLYMRLCRGHREMYVNALPYIVKLRQCAVCSCLVRNWYLEMFGNVNAVDAELLEWMKDVDGTAGRQSNKLNEMMRIIRDIPKGWCSLSSSKFSISLAKGSRWSWDVRERPSVDWTRHRRD